MARRRNIYDASYQTPLADFLEQLPDYVLKYEQLKQGQEERKEARAFRDKQYNNQLNQQRLNNQYRNQQAIKQEKNRIFDNHKSLMQGMPDFQKTQYIDKVLKKDPALKDYMDFSEYDNFSDNIKQANTDYDSINDDVDNYRGSSDMSMFSRYSEVANSYQQLQSIEKNVRGTDLELSHAKDLKYVGDLKKKLETMAGREMSEKDMPPTLQEQFKSLVKTNDSDYKSMVETQDELVKYAVLNEEGKWVQRTPSEGENKNLIKIGFSKAKLAYDNSLSRFRASKFQRNNFTKQQGLFYPEITTAKEQQEQLDNQSEIRTSWFNENENFINQDPESAELALQYLEDPANADRFSALQESVSDRKSADNFMATLNQKISDSQVGGSNEDEEKIPDNVPEMWLEPATELIDSEVDVFENLTTEQQLRAQSLKDRGLTNEQVFSSLESEKEPDPLTRSSSDKQIPAVLEPLTAKRDTSTEAVVEQKRKEAQGAELFTEPKEIETLKSDKEYNLADIKKTSDTMLGGDSAKARRYISTSAGKDFRQLVDLRKRLPSLKERGDSFNIKQLNEKISKVEDKIRKSIGKFINPETGGLSSEEYTNIIYASISSALPGNPRTREIQDLLREFSTATPKFSKKKKKTFTSS
tara:strand:- start:137 stop:2056 length:1920 start_codon:yes stop_codon:yes gene_type:complete